MASEQRAFRRFKLVVPALFRWKDEAEHHEVGCCMNIAAAGIFILTSRCPPAGSRVEIEVVLPAFDPASTETRLHCVGRVTRVQSADELTGYGFAASGHF